VHSKVNVLKPVTTGACPFPECQMHSGKTPKHSGKASPSATLGEGLPGKRPSPSAKSRALGEAFPECRAPSRGRFNIIGAISHFFTVPRVQHSGKKFPFLKSLPRVQHSGNKFIFFRNRLPRVPYDLALGEAPFVFF
jgi:hypothetical protein